MTLIQKLLDIVQNDKKETKNATYFLAQPFSQFSYSQILTSSYLSLIEIEDAS